jgi:hypothetical protein
MHKLSQKEVNAFLTAFDPPSTELKSLSDQSYFFVLAYYFVNLYAAIAFSLYFIFEILFLPGTGGGLQNDYIKELLIRDFSFFWVLGAINLAFFFGCSFRFIVIVTLLYVINLMVEQFFILYSTFDEMDMSIFTIYIMSRPLFFVGLIILGKTYQES